MVGSVYLPLSCILYIEGVYRTADETVAEENAMYPPAWLEEDPSKKILRTLEEALRMSACIELLKKMGRRIAIGYELVGTPVEMDEIFQNNYLRALKLHEVRATLWFTVPDGILNLEQKLREYHDYFVGTMPTSEALMDLIELLIVDIRFLLEEINLLRDWAIEKEARFAYFSRY